jgi:AhpD family alkylhydroperoxidase
MNNDTAKSEVFPPADLASLPDDIRESLLAVQVKAGFVPNVFLKLARRPAEFRAFVAYHDALMLKEEPASPATGGARTRGALEEEPALPATGGARKRGALEEEPASPATGGARKRGALETGALTKGDREMIVVATSAAANCLYCVVSHGALLRIYEKKPLVADQVAVNYRKADITPRQRAMLDFAMKVSLESHTISEADFQPLRAHGFNDEDVWDIAAISAFFAMSNRLANALNMMPNDDFYLMGRVPRAKK